jgi:hypothetical protein
MWSYKAYDEKFKIHTGNEEADDFMSLALNLRQRGLQIVEGRRLSDRESMLEKRLMKLKGTPKDRKKESCSLIHLILLKIKSIFFVGCR